MSDEKRHPLYFEAKGGIGKWDAEVYLAYSPRHARRDSSTPLLCRIEGVRKEVRPGDHSSYDLLRVDFATEATDEEHDRAHLVDIWLAAPKTTTDFDDWVTIVGFGFDLCLPTQEWLDGQLASTDMCDYDGCQGDKAHQILEYLPPLSKEVDALGTPLLIIEFKRRGVS